MQLMENGKPQSFERQMTGLVGELFVAAELLRMGLQCSVTFGNAKAIDLLALNPASARSFTVQVKSVRKRNLFSIQISQVNSEHVYVFVVLNDTGELPEYFIVPGRDIKNNPARFGRYINLKVRPGIEPKCLEDYKNAWNVFTKGSKPIY